MGDYIETVTIRAYVQENGIIRFANNGLYLGRLDGVEYNELKELTANSNVVVVDAGKLEHLLNCMDNQKFIHEQNAETQKEWQDIIDKANRDMRSTLSAQRPQAPVSASRN